MLKLCDTKTGDLKWEVEANNNGDYLYAVAFSPGTDQVATGGADNKVRVYSVADGELVGEIDHSSNLAFLSFHGSFLVSASEDNLVVSRAEAGCAVRSSRYTPQHLPRIGCLPPTLAK